MGHFKKKGAYVFANCKTPVEGSSLISYPVLRDLNVNIQN